MEGFFHVGGYDTCRPREPLKRPHLPLLSTTEPARPLPRFFEEPMSRKPTKGYFVRGQFVAAGSELDLELKRELKGSVDMSKTDMKRESDRLQDLGEQLLTLNSSLFKKLVDAEHLPEKLVITLDDTRRITNFEGRRRQIQFIGKLMRKLEDESIAAIEAALEEQRKPSAEATLALHQAEQWRDKLVADDDALTAWMALAPETDVQHLRTLIRQARKDAQGVKERPGEALRHGKAFRDIFQLVRNALNPAVAGEQEEDNTSEQP
jgi:ribosome-associated protein